MDDFDALVNELPDEIVDYIDDLQTQVASLTKRLDEAETIAKAYEADEDEDEVEYLSPLEKALGDIEDDEARAFIIEKLNEAATVEIEKRDAEFIAKARTFDGLGDPDVLGPALRRLADALPEDVDIFEKALSAAAQQVNESNTLYDEIGHAVSKSSDVLTEVENIAKSYREADPALDPVHEGTTGPSAPLSA
jgi:hypothetical protein